MVEVAQKLSATDNSKESWDFLVSESWSDHEEEGTVKPVASRNSENSGISKARSTNSPHHLHMSPVVVLHGEGLFDRTTNLRPKSNG